MVMGSLQKKQQNIFLRYLKVHGDFSIKNNYEILSLSNENVFFGYYDKTPFNFDDTKILAVETKGPIKPQIKPIEGFVGYFDLAKDNPYESSLSFKTQRVSNDTYFRVHDINTGLVDSENTNLENKISYNFKKNDTYLNITGIVYEDL